MCSGIRSGNHRFDHSQQEPLLAGTRSRGLLGAKPQAFRSTMDRLSAIGITSSVHRRREFAIGTLRLRALRTRAAGAPCGRHTARKNPADSIAEFRKWVINPRIVIGEPRSGNVDTYCWIRAAIDFCSNYWGRDSAQSPAERSMVGIELGCVGWQPILHNSTQTPI